LGRIAGKKKKMYETAEKKGPIQRSQITTLNDWKFEAKDQNTKPTPKAVNYDAKAMMQMQLRSDLDSCSLIDTILKQTLSNKSKRA
jgi:hypothetical protein